MKIQATLIISFLLAGCALPPSDTTAARSPQAEAMPAAQPSANPEAAAAPQVTAAPAAGSATGTVEDIESDAGKITIAHGPVDALKWPAMTMSFKATPEQMAAVKAGQKVDFAFVSAGMDATLTRIEPAK